MPKVDIAMATYNGSKYIEQQIESILKQTHTDWVLYVSDDGSNDDTVDIVKRYALSDERIILVNDKRQGGVIPNFNRALQATTAEYIALSDQDDYWPEERLDKLLKKIVEKDDANKPVLVYSDLILVDKDLQQTATSFYKSNSINPYNNLDVIKLLWKCSVYGCTVIMNRRLLDKSLPMPADITMHDNWLALNAATEDGIYYLDSTTILYRQHESNVVGGGKKTLFNKIKSISKNYKNIKKYSKKVIALLNHAKNIKGNEYLKSISFEGLHGVKFSIKKILPCVLKDDRKIYSLFMFFCLMVKR